MTYGQSWMKIKLEAVTPCSNLITFQGSSDFPWHVLDLLLLLFYYIFLKTSLCSLGDNFTSISYRQFHHITRSISTHSFCTSWKHISSFWYLINCRLELELKLICPRKVGKSYFPISNSILYDKLHCIFVYDTFCIRKTPPNLELMQVIGVYIFFNITSEKSYLKIVFPFSTWSSQSRDWT